MNNRILKKFEATDVIIEVIDGVPMFELYSTGMAIGYVTKANNKLYPHKTRIDNIINSLNIKPLKYNEKLYLSLEEIKDFISMSNTESKHDFLNRLKDLGYIEYNEVFFNTRKEIGFINFIEDCLGQFNIKGVKQYSMFDGKYRIDYYIPSLNVAIEYDENGHKHYSYEEHELRQKEIENELHCKFIRVTDDYSIGTATGIVLKELFGMKIA